MGTLKISPNIYTVRRAPKLDSDPETGQLMATFDNYDDARFRCNLLWLEHGIATVIIGSRR